MSAPTSKGTALITGASTGIGAVYADRLAKRGYDLILVARSEEKLSEVAARLKATGRRIETFPADLTRKEDVQRVAKRLNTDPTITALVNNAGLGSARKLLDEKIDDLESMIYLNVTALTRLALAVLPGFVARKNGLLINIASVVALAPDLLNGTYSGTKAYVVNFTQALKNEVEGKGVTVQAVLPGATATPFWDKSGRPVEDLPKEIVMSAEDMVDASLAGLDRHELITIPALPDAADWERYEAAAQSSGSEPFASEACGSLWGSKLSLFRMPSNRSMKSSEEFVMTAKSTREHLIDVGVGLMHRNGYNATGLTDILKAADVPKGSFYHHFGSKEDFAAAALEKYGMRAREHAAVLNDTTIPPLKRLRHYFSDLMKIYGRNGAIPGCMMGRFSLEIAEESPELRKRISASFDRWQHTIATVIGQAVAEKELPAGTDPESLAGFVLNSWEGALLRSQAEKSNAPLETFMHFVFDALLTNQSKAKGRRQAG